MFIVCFLVSQISFAFQNKHTTQLWTLSSAKSVSSQRSGPDLSRHFTVSINSRPFSSRKLVIRAAGGSSRRSGSSRRVYQESQAQAPVAPVGQVASFILPAGAFVIATFGMRFARYECYLINVLGVFGIENVARSMYWIPS